MKTKQKSKAKMTPLQAIQEYQVPGCVAEFDPAGYAQDTEGIGWKDCASGLHTPVGLIYLGMPKGFNRIGPIFQQYFRMRIFESWEQAQTQWKYDKFNVPVWKYLDPHGNTLVRGMSPRVNQTFLHVILGNCMDKVECLEITDKDLEGMD